jgi:hypothetical protein
LFFFFHCYAYWLIGFYNAKSDESDAPLTEPELSLGSDQPFAGVVGFQDAMDIDTADPVQGLSSASQASPIFTISVFILL